ncbi:MAG: hypothetical protein ACQETI_02790 [Halobacteriota archaeon]
MEEGYRGVFGAFPYAFRHSDSWLFRSYVAVSALTTLLIVGIIGFGLVVLIAQTAAIAGGSLTLSRAFYVVVGLLVGLPVMAPTLLVARRHRRGYDVADRYDFLLAVAGYLFIASLYVGLVITTPENQQQPVSGTLAPAIRLLYDLPQLAGLVPPLVCAVLIWAVHRIAG